MQADKRLIPEPSTSPSAFLQNSPSEFSPSLIPFTTSSFAFSSSSSSDDLSLVPLPSPVYGSHEDIDEDTVNPTGTSVHFDPRYPLKNDATSPLSQLEASILHTVWLALA